jgi:hypothetical protein
MTVPQPVMAASASRPITSRTGRDQHTRHI